MNIPTLVPDEPVRAVTFYRSSVSEETIEYLDINDYMRWEDQLMEEHIYHITDAANEMPDEGVSQIVVDEITRMKAIADENLSDYLRFI